MSAAANTRAQTVVQTVAPNLAAAQASQSQGPGTMLSLSLTLTPHAATRLRQRGIRPDVLDCLLAYGRREHDHAHCEIVYFDTRALERLQREAPSRTAHLAREHRDIYAVVDSDGCIVTAGHRFRRVLRDKSLANVRPRGRRLSVSRRAVL